jgi:hypothetical protein
MKSIIPFFSLALAVALTGSALAQNTQLAFAQAAVVATTTSQTTNTVYVRKAVADGQGNTYLTGVFAGVVQFGTISLTSADASYDVFVAKRDAAGTFLWAVAAGGVGTQWGQSLAVDATGDVVVTGYFGSSTATFGGITLTNAAPATGSVTTQDVFVAKLSGNTRTWLWAVSAGGSTRINGNDEGQSVAVDVFGNVYVTGMFTSSVAFFGPSIQVPNPIPNTFGSTFLAKLTDAGQWVWVKGQDSLGGTTSSVSTDPYGDVYLTGTFGGVPAVFGAYTLNSPRNGAGYVAKIDGNGTWQWATALPSARNIPPARMYPARADGGTGVYIAGSYSGDTLVAGPTVLRNTGAVDPFTRRRTLNGFVARLHAGTGAWRWAVQTGGNGDEDLAPPQLDGAGHVLVAGGFGDLTGYPGGNTFGTTGLQSPGGRDVVVAQLDTAGRWLWARQAGSATSASSGATLYGLDGQGRGLLLGGFRSAAVQLGTFALQGNPGQPAGNEYTGYTARLGANGPVTATKPSRAMEWAVYPNPAHAAVTVVGLWPGQAVQVLDVLGRTVLKGTVPAQGVLQLTLPTTLPTGLYLVRAGVQAQRLIVE